MKDVRKGRSHSGYEVVKYVLSSATEVERIWSIIRDKVEESTGGKFDMSQAENSFVRFALVDGEMYLVVGTTGTDKTTYGLKKDDCESFSSEDAEIRMMSDLMGYETLLTERGMIALDMEKYTSEEELCEIYSKLLNSKSDFNMDLGEMVHMSWKPTFYRGKFVIMPCCTPSTVTSGWDFMVVAGNVVNLC